MFGVDAVHIDEGEAAPGRERVSETRHDDLGVHPVQARACGDEAVRRTQWSRFGGPEDPVDALVIRAWPQSGFAQHRSGRIDCIDALGEPREADRERSGPGSRVEDGPRLDEKPFQDLEDFGWVGLTEPVVAGDLLVLERAAELARIGGTSSNGLSARCERRPDAREAVARS